MLVSSESYFTLGDTVGINYFENISNLFAKPGQPVGFNLRRNNAKIFGETVLLRNYSYNVSHITFH